MSYSPTDAVYPRQPLNDYQRPPYHPDEQYPAQYSAGPSYQPTVLPPSPPASNFTPSTPSTGSYNSSRSIPTVSQTQNQGAKYVHVHNYGPREGSRGTTVYVRADVSIPPSPPSSGPPSANSSPNPSSGRKMMRLCFGTTPAATTVVPVQPTESLPGGYELSATVPSLQQSGPVEIKVQVLSETHLVFGETSCGMFDYRHYEFHPSPRSMKRSGEALLSDRPSPSPRLMAQPIPGRRHLPHQNSMPGESPEAPSEAFQHSKSLPSRYRDDDDQYALPAMTGYRDAGAPPRLPPSYASPNTATPPSAPAHLPSHTPTAPSLSDTPPQPALHRTTQLGVVVGNAPAYNAYASPQSNKAQLVLQGDLNTMAVGWDQDEWHGRRRLVQFWRRQQGSEIHAVFRPVPQEHFQPNSIVISCIYREDKNECFVTSVDAIYLLEALVGTRFTVEEKNRIRRNLEGFRPITVSKTKPGSEAFFKLIMSFPNPKPRNIEKDVKVFPWSIFGPALKKIISKYSASYPGSSATHGYPMLEEPVPSYSVPTPLQPPPHHNQPAYSPPHPYDSSPKHDAAHYRHEPHYGVAPSSHSAPSGGYGYYQQEPASNPSYSASQFAGPPPLQTMHSREELQPVYAVSQ